MQGEEKTVPSWLPGGEIVLAQLCSGIAELYQRVVSAEPFRLPYPANLQLALDKLTLLSWHRGVAPPTDVVDLLRWSTRPFSDWPLYLEAGSVDPDEALVVRGVPSQTCEELGALHGDVVGEIRENALVRAVMDKARAARQPESYVAFRRLLIERPAISALELDGHLSRPELAILADEIHQAYDPAPPEAIADGVARTCGGCHGVQLLLDDNRTWRCADLTCPKPSRAGRELPAAEGVWWLRRELRTFIVGPGRAELRIAKVIGKDVPVSLWPRFDACDLSVFVERPWVADVKAWRSPIRLARHLRERLFTVPADAEKAFIVIADEQVRARPGYVGLLQKRCPAVSGSGRVVAVSEREFVRLVKERRSADAADR